MTHSKIYIIVGLVLVLSIFFSGCFNENTNDVTDDADTLYVDINGAKQYSSIQNAIDSAPENYTVYVFPGVYNEKLVINKTINLIGDNLETTIIDGNKEGDVITITDAEFCNISGFTVQNCGLNEAAIYITSPNNNISSNIIKSNNNGIYASSVKHITIYDNTFISNDLYGIYLSGSDSNIVKNNVFTNNTYGMRVKARDNLITRNLFQDNERGLFFCCYAEDNIVYYNSFINNSEYHALDTTQGEIWYNADTLQGNYWDDYTGDDENKDGVGDTAYNISYYGSNQDPYPLTNPIDVKR